METAQIVKRLKSLVQLDIDAVHAYEQAIEKIDISKVKDQLDKYKNDHKRHIENLSTFIRGYGEDAPKFSPDLKGYLIQGFTALRSITGTEGALKAMKSNEELTNKTYDEALSWDLPPNIRDTVKQNREDERRHLQYINEALSNRVWEKTSEDKLDELEEEIDQEKEEGEIVEKRKKAAS